jgi:hypothetical protein
MLCATLRRRRRSLDSLEDYRLLAPSHRCSSCGRKYSRSKILSKVRKLISQTGTVLVADWLVDRVVYINRTYHLLLCCCVTRLVVVSFWRILYSGRNLLLFRSNLLHSPKNWGSNSLRKVSKFLQCYSEPSPEPGTLRVTAKSNSNLICLSICSNVGRYIGYPNWCFSWCLSSLLENSNLVSEISF